jgi:hypothetical protein
VLVHVLFVEAFVAAFVESFSLCAEKNSALPKSAPKPALK